MIYIFAKKGEKMKNNFLKKGITILLGGFMMFSAVACGGDNSGGNNSVNSTPVNPITVISVANESKNVFFMDGDILTYFSEDYQSRFIDDFVNETSTKGDVYYQKGVSLSWKDESATPSSYYIVYLSESANFESSRYLFAQDGDMSVIADNLKRGTKYYWYVEREDGEASSTFSFTTSDAQPATVKIEGISNTRDIGGYLAANGKTVKQGMVYRAAELDGVTRQGIKTVTETLKIKTDLDLRKAQESGKIYSPLGNDIQYINISAPLYSGIFEKDAQAAMRDIIKVFADKNNYPIMFHCSLGRDRTGTLAFLLDGLLGVPYFELLKEYELSYFSNAVNKDFQTSATMTEGNLNAMYSKLMSTYGRDNELSENIEKYLLEIGVTAEEIQSIKDILLV